MCIFIYLHGAITTHTQTQRSCNDPNHLHYIIIIIIIIVGSQLAWLCEAAAQQSMYDTFVVLMSPMTCVCVCVCVQSIVRRMRSISSSTILFRWVLHIFFLLVLHNLNIYNYLYFAWVHLCGTVCVCVRYLYAQSVCVGVVCLFCLNLQRTPTNTSARKHTAHSPDNS